MSKANRYSQAGPCSFSCSVAGTSDWNLPPFSLLCPCLLSLNTFPNYFYHLPWSFMLLSLQRSFLFQSVDSSVFSVSMILLENAVLVPAGEHYTQHSGSGLQPISQADWWSRQKEDPAWVRLLKRADACMVAGLSLPASEWLSSASFVPKNQSCIYHCIYIIREVVSFPYLLALPWRGCLFEIEVGFSLGCLLQPWNFELVKCCAAHKSRIQAFFPFIQCQHIGNKL